MVFDSQQQWALRLRLSCHDQQVSKCHLLELKCICCCTHRQRWYECVVWTQAASHSFNAFQDITIIKHKPCSAYVDIAWLYWHRAVRYSGLCRDSFKQRIRICDLLFKSLFLRLHRRRAAVWSRATAYGFIPWFASEDCTEPSLPWTSSREFLLETEWGTNSFQCK